MTLGVQSVIYFVADLAVAKSWYNEVFEVIPYFDEPFYVGYRVGGSELGLDPDPEAGESGPGGSVAYWGVDDLDVAMARIIGIGSEVVEPIRDVGGGIRLAVVADPFGNSVGLIQQSADQANTNAM